MLDLIVLHGEFSLFTVRGNFWYQIYRNRRKKVLCSRLSLITLTNWIIRVDLIPEQSDYIFNFVSVTLIKSITSDFYK